MNAVKGLVVFQAAYAATVVRAAHDLLCDGKVAEARELLREAREELNAQDEDAMQELRQRTREHAP